MISNCDAKNRRGIFYSTDAYLPVVHVVVGGQVLAVAGEADSQPRPPELPVVGNAPHDGENAIHVADAPTDHSVRSVASML